MESKMEYKEIFNILERIEKDIQRMKRSINHLQNIENAIESEDFRDSFHEILNKMKRIRCKNYNLHFHPFTRDSKNLTKLP